MLYTKAKANLRGSTNSLYYYLTNEGLKWYKQGLEASVKSRNYLAFDFKRVEKASKAAFVSGLEQQAASAPRHIVACGALNFCMPNKSFDYGVVRRKDVVPKELLAKTARWVQMGVEKDNPCC